MSDSKQLTSLSLLAKVRDNDQEAWEQLIHLYGPLVQRWCLRSKLNDSDAADVFQETFRAVARNLPNYKPTKAVGSFRSWLRTITRTKIADHFRRLNSQAIGQGGTAAQIQIANVEDPLDDDSEEQAEEDQSFVVSRAMELIQPEFSEQNWLAFQKVAIDGMSAADVARDLGVQPQTIRQANYRIRNRLRVVLRDLVET